jgi:type I restriction enzyme S subunit
MKQSGIDWIGSIPSHWDTTRIKHIFKESKERSIEGKELPLSLGKVCGLVPSSQKETKTLEAASFVNFKIVHPGEVVFNRFKARLFAVSKYDGIVTPEYAVYKDVGQHDLKYFVYLFGTEPYRAAFENKASGIGDGYSRLYTDDLFSMPTILPPFSEQSRIAAFLDERCAKIDEAIAKHKALVEKLDEYRKGIITEAVTGGIFYNEETKDLPKGWTLCRIKNLLSPSKEGIKIGPFGSSLTGKVLGDAEYKVYGQWNIVGKDFSAGKNYVNEDTFKALYSYVVVEGDVLISMMGTIGKCTIIPSGIQPGIMVSHVIKARLNSLILPRFFEYEYDKDNFHYVYKQMLVNKTGSIMDGLNSTVVKNLHFILPPLVEQQKIVAYLDEKCAAIDSVKERHTQLIAKLEEYKKSLIYNAVTGKIEC